MSSPQHKNTGFRSYQSPFAKPQFSHPQGFIPLGYSTPTGAKTQDNFNSYNKTWYSNTKHKPQNYNEYNSRRVSGKHNDIWSYFHPSMLEDPWKHLTYNQKQNKHLVNASHTSNIQEKTDSFQNEGTTSSPSTEPPV